MPSGERIAEFYRRPLRGVDPVGTQFGFQRSYAELFAWAQESGQLPGQPHARVLAEMLFSLTMGAINAWVLDEDVDLAAELRSRAAVLIAGARRVAPPAALTERAHPVGSDASSSAAICTASSNAVRAASGHGPGSAARTMIAPVPHHRTFQHQVVGETERLDVDRVVDDAGRVVAHLRRVAEDRAVAAEQVAHLERGADVGTRASERREVDQSGDARVHHLHARLEEGAGLLAQWESAHVGTVAGIPTVEPVPRADRLLGASDFGGLTEEHVGAGQIHRQSSGQTTRRNAAAPCIARRYAPTVRTPPADTPHGLRAFSERRYGPNSCEIRRSRGETSVQDFNGKVAVVTGGASGIGEGLVEALLQEGAKVVIADIEQPVLDEALGRLEGKGEVSGIVTDVSRPDSVEACAQQVYDTYGVCHLLFNNAGCRRWRCGQALELDAQRLGVVLRRQPVRGRPLRAVVRAPHDRGRRGRLGRQHVVG